MVPLLIVLLAGVLVYSWWRWRFTTLTRDCRWRQDRAAGVWTCAACGARVDSRRNKAPTDCLRKN